MIAALERMADFDPTPEQREARRFARELAERGPGEGTSELHTGVIAESALGLRGR
jgi:hypothetical protein